MIIASCRQRFTSTRLLAKRTHFRNYPDPSQPSRYETLDIKSLLETATNQHICILVHGFNNTMDSVLGAYAELHTGMRRTGVAGPDGYGLVIGFAWPGWTSAPGFLAARPSANRAGAYLRQLVNDLRPVALSIDIQTHSLGARVALTALKKPRTVFVDNLLLSAAAVDYTVFNGGSEFHKSLESCNRCMVYHSRRDAVLKKAFPIGDMADGIKKALGLSGPKRLQTALQDNPNLYVVDCASCVFKHGDYRKAEPYYTHWHLVLSGAPIPRPDAL